MATTANGTPYVVSSDTITSYPTTSLALANSIDSQLAAKANYVRQATAPTGAYNTFWEDTSTTPSVVKIWNGSAYVPFSAAGYAKVSSYTGSPTVGTYTDTGVTYTTYQWTSGTGTITFSGSGGYVDLLLVGGGGGGCQRGGGGAGGMLFLQKIYVPGGSAITATVGNGGPYNTAGGNSSFGQYVVIGGGKANHTANENDAFGGSGGGAPYGPQFGGVGVPGQGYKGGNGVGSVNGGAGGGGAGAAGTNSTSNSGATGGNGAANSITGSSVTYAGGGGGATLGGGGAAGGSGGGGAGGTTGTNGTAGLGGGGGGAANADSGAGSGGSGRVIIRTVN